MKVDSSVCSIMPIIVPGIVDIRCFSLILVMQLVFVMPRSLGGREYKYTYINDIALVFKHFQVQREG